MKEEKEFDRKLTEIVQNINIEPNKNPKRVLIEFSKIKVNYFEEKELIIENEERHQYSSDYFLLTIT